MISRKQVFYEKYSSTKYISTVTYNDSKIKIGINYKMKREIKKIDNNLTNVFDKIQKENSDFSYRKSNIPVYDYILTTKKYRYYVKIIFEFNPKREAISMALDLPGTPINNL